MDINFIPSLSSVGLKFMYLLWYLLIDILRQFYVFDLIYYDDVCHIDFLSFRLSLESIRSLV